MPFGANPRGRIEGRLNVPSLTGSDLWINGRFDGDVGGVRTAMTATLDGDKLDRGGRRERESEGAARTLAPDLPVQAPILVHLDGEGTLPNVGFRAQTRFGRGVLDLDGTVGLAEPVGGSTRFRAEDVDLREVWPGTPTSKVAALGEVSVSVRHGRPYGAFRFRTEPGHLADRRRSRALAPPGDSANPRPVRGRSSTNQGRRSRPTSTFVDLLTARCSASMLPRRSRI